MQQEAAHLLFDWTNASFEEAEAEVRRWGDRRGRGVDPLIVPVVVGLNLLGIRTVQSCQGHLDSGFAYPWVMFERPICPCYLLEWQTCQDDSGHDEIAAYHASDQLHEVMAQCPHRPAEALMLADLLVSFYAAPTRPLVHLTIDYTGPTFYRLIPVVSSTLREGKAETLVRCQAEMARFASFLKARCKTRAQRIVSSIEHAISHSVDSA